MKDISYKPLDDLDMIYSKYIKGDKYGSKWNCKGNPK